MYHPTTICHSIPPTAFTHTMSPDNKSSFKDARTFRTTFSRYPTGCFAASPNVTNTLRTDDVKTKSARRSDTIVMDV